MLRHLLLNLIVAVAANAFDFVSTHLLKSFFFKFLIA